MAIPARLSRKLRDVLGTEAAEDMVTLIEDLRSDHEAIADVAAALRRLDERIQGVEVRLTKEIGDVKADLGERIGNAKADFGDRIGSMQADVGDRIGSLQADLGNRIGNVKADLMKWSFLFWVGAVAAIAMLAGVLGR